MYKSISASAACKWLVALAVAQMAQAPPALVALMVLMAIDYGMGVGAAYVQHRISSDAGGRGLAKKAMTFGLILSTHVMERLFGVELGAEKVIACAYCANEAISIVENASAAGVPIPTQLVAVLGSMKSLRAATPEQLKNLEGDK